MDYEKLVSGLFDADDIQWDIAAKQLQLKILEFGRANNLLNVTAHQSGVIKPGPPTVQQSQPHSSPKPSSTGVTDSTEPLSCRSFINEWGTALSAPDTFQMVFQWLATVDSPRNSDPNIPIILEYLHNSVLKSAAKTGEIFKPEIGKVKYDNIIIRTPNVGLHSAHLFMDTLICYFWHTLI